MRLWVAASYDATWKNGGWAFVRADGAEVTGWAGGDRRTTHALTALAAFAEAVKDLPPGVAPKVVAPRAEALILHTLVKPAADPPPAEEAALRAALGKALAGRAWTLAVGDPAAIPPLGFAAAWAALAADKAKAAGAFRNAIPKPNLARVKV